MLDKYLLNERISSCGHHNLPRQIVLFLSHQRENWGEVKLMLDYAGILQTKMWLTLNQLRFF